MAQGAVLGGKYRLEAVVGKGGMGSVWRARNLKLDAAVAVKLMHPSIVADEAALRSFHREAHACAMLRSPHILQVFDHDVDAATGCPYIVMELLDGEPLSSRLERVGLSLEQTEAVVRDVCRGLAVAHQHGVIHRDIKPENVFLVHNQDEELAKILDFGIAKAPAFALGPSTQTGAMMGTPFYMSPEQIRGSKQLDARSDLWSVAIIVYECVTGRRPFEADSLGALAVSICTEAIRPPSQWGRVPALLDDWFTHALDRDPGRRFQTAGELAQAFSLACAKATGAAGRSGSRRRSASPAEPTRPARATSAAAGVRGGDENATIARGELAEPQSAHAARASAAARGAPSRLVFAFVFLLVLGIIGFGLWRQNQPSERVVAGSSGRPAPAQVSEFPRFDQLGPWLPLAIVFIGSLGYNLFLRRRA